MRFKLNFIFRFQRKHLPAFQYSLLFRLCLWLGLAWSLGCQKYLRGPEPSESIRVQQTETQCLQDFPDQMRSYLQDELARPGIDSMTDCVKSSLITFSKLTRGLQESEYTAEELRQFFNRYFLSDHQISSDLMREFMKLKVLFFGGSASALTRIELGKMTETLEILRLEGHSLAGHWKMLLFGEMPALVDAQRLQNLEVKLIDSIQKFLRRNQVNLTQYEWYDFQTFLSELEKFLGGPEHMAQVRKWLPLIDQTKLTFMGQRTLSSHPRDADAQIEWAGRAYFLALEYFYLIQHLQSTRPLDAQKLVRFLDEVLQLVESSPQIRQFGAIPFSQIEALLEELWKLQLVPSVVSLPILKDTLRKAIWSFLEGRQSLGVSSVINLDRKALGALRFEFGVWKAPFEYLARIFQTAPGPLIPYENVVKYFNSITESEAFQVSGLSPSERGDFRLSWEEYLQLIHQKIPLVWTPNAFFIVSHRAKLAEVGFDGLVRTLTYRSLTRLLLRGFGDRSAVNIWSQGISQSNLIALEKTFREFGVATQFLDSRHDNPARRTFLEGNYFPLSANGDQSLSSKELLEMMHLLFSGGQSSARSWIELARHQGCGRGHLDVFSVEKVELSCLRRILRASPERILEGMPGFVMEIRSASEEQFDEFFRDLISISRYPGDAGPENEFSYADARGAMTLMYYLESLLLSFDSNRDQVLDDQELWKAAERFKLLLAPVEPKYWREGFVSLVKNGHPPQGLEKLGVFLRSWLGMEPSANSSIPVPGRELTWTLPSTDNLQRIKMLKAVLILKSYL